MESELNSSHTSLSHTIADPSLEADINLQNGHNYIMGLQLLSVLIESKYTIGNVCVCATWYSQQLTFDRR